MTTPEPKLDPNVAPLDVCGWRRLSSVTTYDNPWISVHHHEVLTPSGSKGIYGLVHFKGHAVGVVPIDADDHTYLVRQSRYTIDRYTWEIPEGGAHAGESPMDCARRELQEECGVSAARITPLLELHTSNSVTDERASVFVARELTVGKINLDPTEDIEVRRLPLEEAIAMALSGEITDAISVAALFKLALLRRTGVEI